MLDNRIIRSSLFLVLSLGALGLTACDKQDAPKPEATPQPAKTEAKPTEKPAEKPADKPAGATAELKGSYKLDTAHSVVVFSAKHAGLSWTYGSFNKVDGKITIDEDLAKSSVELDIDANSLFTAVKKRDDHLKGPDFFNTKQFPNITFKSKEIKADGDNYSVTGDLTLHGVTKPVTLTMNHVGHGDFPMDKSFRAGFEGTTTIKRSEFDMKNMLEAASDEVRLTIAIEAIRQ
ncbi:MAG: YceI family protein [Polyangiaceae bacterium]